MKIISVRDNLRPSGAKLIEFEGDKFALVEHGKVIDCYRVSKGTALNGALTVGDSVRARMVQKLRKSGHV